MKTLNYWICDQCSKTQRTHLSTLSSTWTRSSNVLGLGFTKNIQKKYSFNSIEYLTVRLMKHVLGPLSDQKIRKMSLSEPNLPTFVIEVVESDKGLILMSFCSYSELVVVV